MSRDDGNPKIEESNKKDSAMRGSFWALGIYVFLIATKTKLENNEITQTQERISTLSALFSHYNNASICRQFQISIIWFSLFFTLLSISAQRLVFSQQRLSVQMSCLFQRCHLALVRRFTDQRQADDIEWKTALDHMAESSRLLRLRHFLEFYMLCLSLSQNAFFFVENHHILISRAFSTILRA